MPTFRAEILNPFLIGQIPRVAEFLKARDLVEWTYLGLPKEREHVPAEILV